MKTLRRYDYALSPTSQFYFCGLPFRFDVAPNCSLGCAYCFSSYNVARRTAHPALADPAQLERKLKAVFDGRSVLGNINNELLTRYQPLHFGGLTDPFMNTEVTNITLRILKAFNRYHYPVVISAKNTDFIVRNEVLRTLSEMKLLSVQISISSPEDKWSKVVEPRVPLVSERIRALSVLSREGIHCSVRLQPLFVPWIQAMGKVLVPALAQAGCRHVIVECLKIPYVGGHQKFIQLFERIGWDGFSFYRKSNAVTVGRELVLPPHLKWEMLRPLNREIHSAGMTYGSGDYGLNHMGDTECCCGIDGIPGFGNWFRPNFASVIRRAKGGLITFCLLENEDIPGGSIKRYLNSHSRIDGDNTLRALLCNKWNRPGSPNAPDSFLYVDATNEKDQKGNVIYQFGVGEKGEKAPGK